MHETMRFSMEKLVELVGYSSFAVDDADFNSYVQRFGVLFRKVKVLYEEHARHQEQFLFKSMEDYYPDVPKLTRYMLLNQFEMQPSDALLPSARADHTRDITEFNNIETALVCLETHALNMAQALDDLKNVRSVRTCFHIDLITFPQRTRTLQDNIKRHSLMEEEDVCPLCVKCNNLKLQRKLVQKMWECTPSARWRQIVDLIMNFSPQHQYRLSFIKSLTNTMPERTEMLGLMVYNSVSGNLWSRLMDDVSEISPRGFWRHSRYW